VYRRFCRCGFRLGFGSALALFSRTILSGEFSGLSRLGFDLAVVDSFVSSLRLRGRVLDSIGWLGLVKLLFDLTF
jgi:hypothetical protein